ncbi:MAG: hypothetical protein ACLGGZ_03555, partial [Alphaproteobacteria bacterium]
AQFWRPAMALGVAIAIRLAGLGLENLVEKNPLITPGLYLWPLFVLAICLFLLTDEGQYWLGGLRARLTIGARRQTG